jgi:CRISPR system Cascade subunit CasE
MYFNQLRRDGCVADTYTMHQEIWDLFATPIKTPRDFLYRVSEQNKQTTVLVVSARLPVNSSQWQVRSKEYHPQVALGDVLSFTLHVNPTKSYHGKRHAIVVSEYKDHVVDWLCQQGKKRGFDLQEVDHTHQQECFTRGGHQISFLAYDIEGILKVTDADLFKATLQKGLGKERGFGCGLLLVARPISSTSLL